VEITVIALWLGHKSATTTHMYDRANLAMKERALKNLKSPNGIPVRYHPPDRLLAFLQDL
jgi:integrase/recombinase XerD